VFADLVEAKSFSKAATRNGFTQSAVSQQTRVVEQRFRKLLIDRSQKPFQITREGQRVYEAAKSILDQYEKLMCELQEMKHVVNGTIRIATIYSIGLHELQPDLKKFRQEYPQVSCEVEYRRSRLVYDDVRHNAADLGLVAYPEPARQIEIIPFRTDRLVLITHPQHPLARAGTKVDFKVLAEHPFLGFDPDIPTRRTFDQLFRNRDVTIEPVMEIKDIETLKRAVEINHGVAIVPQATVRQQLQQGTLAALGFKGMELSRPLAIIHRKGRAFTPAMRKFIETLGVDLPPG
jgi:DNA-binding transcriptional LysR family regulator